MKVLRHSSSRNGDKIATGYGQKEVLKIHNEIDLIYGYDENNEVVKFDMVMALSSINNILTIAQHYEVVSGAQAARTGGNIIIKPHDCHNDYKGGNI